jgi:hypothetical protein
MEGDSAGDVAAGGDDAGGGGGEGDGGLILRNRKRWDSNRSAQDALIGVHSLELVSVGERIKALLAWTAANEVDPGQLVMDRVVKALIGRPELYVERLGEREIGGVVGSRAIEARREFGCSMMHPIIAEELDRHPQRRFERLTRSTLA